MSDYNETPEEYWYNTRTGEVEQGKQSISSERLGPFPTFEQAERANEKLAENARAWAEEEAAEDDE
ncbi:SPOR domain-containing protein [Gulosibacter macacae]|uniref:SPOR domain-containing protein n=1 Tax=Gulosibacter macacae TaxID=2488791 RepID=A0A3P3W175_9MICO|nr:SPOR domain-containing protein [Gulosibacter macacae]RRJ88802.1 SPOR domain-containing protein [Gulosibacter macacae]